MITEDVEVTIATGTFPNNIELEEFLNIFDRAGYARHLAKPTETHYSEGEYVAVLHIKKEAQFIVMASLDEDSAFSKWGEHFSFAQPLA